MSKGHWSMRRVALSIILAASPIVVGVLAPAGGTALASTPSSTGFLTYHDSVYGYSIS
jgi:hypothetical protein